MTVVAMAPARWSQSFIGIPYLDGGESFKAVDCGGLVKLVYRDCLNIELNMFNDVYVPDDVLATAQRVSNLQGHPPFTRHVTYGNEQEYDVVLMKALTEYQGVTHITDSHLGVVTAPGWILHIDRHSLSHQERLAKFEPRIVTIVRHDQLK